MKIHTIHFVGIKGVGMAPLAVIAKEAGKTVTGSDVDAAFITDIALESAGIIPSVGFLPEHVGTPDLVITTGAHGGMTNPEVIEARAREIPVLLQGQAVGEFMKGELFGKQYTGISVAGTHGKTTTTAMIATVLSENDMDPGYLIGTSEIPSLGNAGHFGSGEYFVAEADEYATDPTRDKTAKFLWQHPTYLVITNIEHDHPDVYASLDQMTEAYKAFVTQLPETGVIIACGDSQTVTEVLSTSKAPTITYGLHETNDVILANTLYKDGQLHFELRQKGMESASFALHVAGVHNALNAVAAITLCRLLKLSDEQIRRGLLAFKGTKRRLEYKGRLTTGAELYDDYAHHPTEIKASIEAIRELYPDRKIICIFQPHTYSRTKELLEQFKGSFEAADMTLITEIYASSREVSDTEFSARLLADGIKGNVLFLEKLSDVIKYVTSQEYGHDTILLTMGAGDIYTIASVLLQK